MTTQRDQDIARLEKMEADAKEALLKLRASYHDVPIPLVMQLLKALRDQEQTLSRNTREAREEILTYISPELAAQARKSALASPDQIMTEQSLRHDPACEQQWGEIWHCVASCKSINEARKPNERQD